MEGPSLVIACEELAQFRGKKITSVSGALAEAYGDLAGKSLRQASSWGKHLILKFSNHTVRIHFLMFGSYRIDNPRKNRVPKLQLTFPKHVLYFYSCAIRELTKFDSAAYDWSVDLMSEEWNATQALRAIRSHPRAEICDVLMDQEISAGLGNIMKNEILFRLRLHPRTKVCDLPAAGQRRLVKEARNYAWLFYEWKKRNQLKKHWQIMRKKTCPVCGGRVTKKATGNLARLSHYCSRCQPKV